MPAPRACGGLKTAAPQRPKLLTSAEMTLGTTNTFGSSNLHVLLCIVQTIPSAQYVELPVALDAVWVVVSTKNTWLKDLMLGEAKALFDPASV